MSYAWRWVPSRRWLVLPPVLVGIGAILYMAMSGQPLPRSEMESSELGLKLPLLTVAEESLTPQSTGFGTARAIRSWTAVAQVKGQVIERNPDLESGNTVGKGELLLALDESDYRSQYQQRQSDLDAAQARVDELRASVTADTKSLAIEKDLLELNRSEERRYRQLSDRNAITPSEFETVRQTLLRQQQSVQQLENRLLLYPSQIASAQASVALAESRLQEATREIERCSIRAPFSGVLAGVSVEEGQFIAQNQSMFELLDTSTIEIDARFSMAQLSQLIETSGESGQVIPVQEALRKLGATVVSRSGDTERKYSATPVRVSDSVDEQTRTLGIVVQIDFSVARQPSGTGERPIREIGSLRPGSFCEVILRGPPRDGVIAIPRSAVKQGAVFVLDSDHRMRRRAVTLGSQFGDRVAVIEGLQAGEILVVKQPVPAIDGTLINVPDDFGDGKASDTDESAETRGQP